MADILEGTQESTLHEQLQTARKSYVSAFLSKVLKLSRSPGYEVWQKEQVYLTLAKQSIIANLPTDSTKLIAHVEEEDERRESVIAEELAAAANDLKNLGIIETFGLPLAELTPSVIERGIKEGVAQNDYSREAPLALRANDVDPSKPESVLTAISLHLARTVSAERVVLTEALTAADAALIY